MATKGSTALLSCLCTRMSLNALLRVGIRCLAPVYKCYLPVSRHCAFRRLYFSCHACIFHYSVGGETAPRSPYRVSGSPPSLSTCVIPAGACLCVHWCSPGSTACACCITIYFQGALLPSGPVNICPTLIAQQPHAGLLSTYIRDGPAGMLWARLVSSPGSLRVKADGTFRLRDAISAGTLRTRTFAQLFCRTWCAALLRAPSLPPSIAAPACHRRAAGLRRGNAYDAGLASLGGRQLLNFCRWRTTATCHAVIPAVSWTVSLRCLPAAADSRALPDVNTGGGRRKVERSRGITAGFALSCSPAAPWRRGIRVLA